MLMLRTTRTLAAGVATAAVLLVAGPVAGAEAAQGEVVLECGATITQDAVLGADIGPCMDDGVVVAADDITFDLNGHKIVGVGGQVVEHQAAGVLVDNRSGVKVVGGTVTGFFHGVRVRQGSGNLVSRMVAVDNKGGNGIVLESSSDNRVSRNEVVQNGQFSGIATFDSFFLPAGAARNAIVDNEVRNNDFGTFATGISIEDGPGHVVSGNIVSGSVGDGIGLRAGVSDSIISRNTVRRNGGRGIALASGADANLVVGNRVTANGGDGIFIGSKNNLIQSNNSLRNGGTDLVDINARCDNNLWSGNTFQTATPKCAGA